MATPSNRIRQEREARGLSQPQLAALARVPLDTLRKHEQGVVNDARLSFALPVASALGVAVESLFFLPVSHVLLAEVA